MKKLLLLSALVFGMNTMANAQEWFISATRKGGPADGYITAGIQPTEAGNKPNVFLAYNPLKPNGDLRLWTIGNLVGSDFTLGLGLSYKLGK